VVRADFADGVFVRHSTGSKRLPAHEWSDEGIAHSHPGGMKSWQDRRMLLCEARQPLAVLHMASPSEHGSGIREAVSGERHALRFETDQAHEFRVAPIRSRRDPAEPMREKQNVPDQSC
jgi:hypothetical protein